MTKKKDTISSGTIALNKKAKHDYHIEEKFEAGMVLSGWEVKSLRAGKAQLVDGYVIIKNEEAWLLGAHISPLQSASTHVIADPLRTRKLLLKKREINRILGNIAKAGSTCIALALYWKGNHIKCEIALARGKQEHDKREANKERDWGRQKQRVIRDHVKQ